MSYELLQGFAKSWMLLGMFVFFVGAVLWVLRPGSRRVHDEAANIIFRNDKNPGPVPGSSKEA